MKTILIVDDDSIIATVYRYKLSSEGFVVKVVRSGEAAIQFVENETPDLIILDWMLPQMDGIGVLKILRSRPATQQTPVILFSNSFLQLQKEEALAAGANRCIDKSNFTSKQMIELIAELILTKDEIQATGVKENLEREAINAQSIVKPSGMQKTDTEIQTSREVKSSTGIAESLQFQTTMIKQISELVPEWLEAFQKNIDKCAFTKDSNAKTIYLKNISQIAHTICGHTATVNMTHISHVASGIVALSKLLSSTPTKINSSSIRTLAQAMDLTLALIRRMQPNHPTTLNPTLILGVDDSEIQRKLIANSLLKVKLRAVVVEDAEFALRLAGENTFDLFFLDIEMPGMNGFELCAKLRAMPQHDSVPVIFVTAHTDFQSHSRSILSGGNDFICKPYIDIELGVKALIYLMINQFQVSTKEMRQIVSKIESDIVW